MISNLEMSYSVATLDSITIQATISSNPKPTVTLYRVAPDGAETILSGDSQPRVSISDTMGNQYGVTFSDVRRSDQGSYRIVVRNGILPNANQTFSLAVTGEHWKGWLGRRAELNVAMTLSGCSRPPLLSSDPRAASF